MATGTGYQSQRCAICGGTYSFMEMAIRHSEDCQFHPDNVKAAAEECAQPEFPSKVSDVRAVVSIGAARFDKAEKPQGLSPRSALEKALEVFDNEPDKRPEHIIVLFGRTTGSGASGTSFYQAGEYAHHAQMGLCYEGREMIRESGK